MNIAGGHAASHSIPARMLAQRKLPERRRALMAASRDAVGDPLAEKLQLAVIHASNGDYAAACALARAAIERHGGGH